MHPPTPTCLIYFVARVAFQVLVDRLAMRHLHLLAVRVCEHLRLRRDRVAVHWACRKIAKSCAEGSAGATDAPTDEELRRVGRRYRVRGWGLLLICMPSPKYHYLTAHLLRDDEIS